MRLTGQDATLLGVANVDSNGATVGLGYSFLADFQSFEFECTRAKADMTSTKDQAEYARATHLTGSVTLTGLQQVGSNGARAFATSSYGVVNWVNAVSGDVWQIPVFIEKVNLSTPGKDSSKETLTMPMNGVPALNGQPFNLI